MPALLFLSEIDVAEAFTLDVAATSAQAAFDALGRGDAVLPERLIVPGADANVAFCYAARISPDAPAVSKFGAVHPGYAARGLDAVNAAVTVLDATTGIPAAVMAATTLTTRRTAAASALAIESLSPESASDLTVIGSGVQALAHLHAVGHRRPLRRIRVHSRTIARAYELAATWGREKAAGLPEVEVVDDPRAACAGADVIVTATTASSPVLETAWLSDDALVVTVGSFTADRTELPLDLLEGARVVVDHRAAALADAGCVVQAVAAGVLDADRVETLGEVLVGGRTDSTRGRTVYASVGVGVQDAAAAAAVLAAAEAGDVGTRVNL